MIGCRQAPSLAVAALLLAGVASEVCAHAGGLLDLNACVRRGGTGGTYRVHFDAFQSGQGPFCNHLPATGEATLVFDLQEAAKQEPVAFEVRRRSESSTVGDKELLLETAAKAHRSGVATETLEFVRPGIYDVAILLPGSESTLVFPLWVDRTPPLSVRAKTLALNVLERPYALLFGLLVLVGGAAYVFSRSRDEGSS